MKGPGSNLEVDVRLGAAETQTNAATSGSAPWQTSDSRRLERGATPVAIAATERWARWTAAAGCLGAIGYGGLKASWAAGATFGMVDPGQLRQPGTATGIWAVENLATVALAALAALILLALVLPAGTFVPRPILRTLGWLGTIMVVPGAVGLVGILDYIAGTHLFRDTKLGGVSPATYVFVYICFLTLGLAFASTTFLTRRSRARIQA